MVTPGIVWDIAKDLPGYRYGDPESGAVVMKTPKGDMIFHTDDIDLIRVVHPPGTWESKQTSHKIRSEAALRKILKGYVDKYGKSAEKKSPAALNDAYTKIAKRKNITAFKKGLPAFFKRYQKAYNTLYKSRDFEYRPGGPEKYRELVERGDELIKTHPEEVAVFNRMRLDLLTSDREVAAFACAWDKVNLSEQETKKKTTGSTEHKLPKVRTTPQSWQVDVLKGPITMNEDDKGHLVIRQVSSGSAMDKRTIFDKLRSSGKKPVIMRPNELFSGRFMDRGAALKALQEQL